MIWGLGFRASGFGGFGLRILGSRQMLVFN